MKVATHRLPRATFDALARGGGDVATIRRLMAGQRSRHLLLVRELVVASRRHPAAGHAAQLSRAVAVLDAAQRDAPEAVARVIGYPFVGAWAAHCLRRLRSAAPDEGSVPLWVDLAQLGAVAGAAAMAARRAVDVSVPTRAGLACLPGFGQAALVSRARFGVARLLGDGEEYLLEGPHDEVLLPSSKVMPRPGLVGAWSPLVRWTFLYGDARLDVVLDDVDPYRNCHGLTSSRRLSRSALAVWNARLTTAWELLCERHPHRAEELSAVTLVITPLEPVVDGPGVNATARDSTGAIAMTPPVDAVDLAQSLVHEFQHSKLGALLDLVELYDLEDTRLFYSPWRADPRPLGGLLQAVYAFLAVGDFWRRQLDAGAEPNVALCRYKLARSRSQLAEAVRTLLESGSLTEQGRRFVEQLRDVIDAVHHLPQTDTALVRTAVVNDHHRASWRLRNLHVPEDDLRTLADAYMSGLRPRGVDVTRVARQRATTWLHDEEPLDELARLEVADTLTRTRSRRNRGGPHPSDLALLRRHYAAAASAYLAELSSDGTDVASWAGLAVARQYTAVPATAYRDAPEVVAQLHGHLERRLGGNAPTPDDVARWLSL